MKNYFSKFINNRKNSKEAVTMVITHPATEEQEDLASFAAKEILNLKENKKYRNSANVFGIWPEEIDRNSIGIDLVKNFIHKAQLKPFNSKQKVGIILEADKMTLQAQNAILKTLEEPPENTFLILCVSKTEKLITTIRSRSKIFEFYKKDKLINNKTIEKLLKSNIIKRFDFVEKLLNEKDTYIKQEKINSLLKNLLIFHRNLLVEKNKNHNENLQKIYLIETTQKAISKNANTRLALENLFINISSD